jgi:acyl transferase domain-containing protein
VSVALLFPGQGSRGVLAGLDLAEASAPGRALVERACAAADVGPARLRERGGRALERTEVLQPVLTAITLAVHSALGVVPAAVLGHSLGEIAAWAAVGGIAVEDAVDVAAVRGRLMAREAAKEPGGLVALGSDEAVREALALGAGTAVAAWNAPDEVVVSGPEASLRAITANLPARRLPVAGAWHGPLMAGAVEELRAALERLPRSTPSARMIGDDGDVVPPDVVPDRLAEALVRPVRFGRALATLGALGVDVFVTVGPGAVLRGLVRKNLGSSARVLTTEDAADLGRTLAALQSAS